jgi:hypothetical protein
MAGANLFVFRENAETIPGRELGKRLLRLVSRVRENDSSSVVDALLLAGEVECALSDLGRMSASKSAQITDALASRFLGAENTNRVALQPLAAEVAEDLPDSLRVSPPEGFAYYALHPGDFADAVEQLEIRAPVGVVGIRSVGTTLSAISLAALKRKGISSSRITVRPAGHPYDRRSELRPEQVAWARELNRAGAAFLIVDEGPGLSGSSFLSSAECLMREGIEADRITLVGTRDVDPAQLCATDASERWKKFACQRVASRIAERFKGAMRLSGGLWRELFLSNQLEQPACWPEMDAVKYWSKDAKHIFKFEGFGEHGRKVRDRATALCEAGFSPLAEDGGDGMSRYRFLRGTVLARKDLSPEVLDHIATYCAFRVREFRSERGTDGLIEEMAHFNYSEEAGRELLSPAGIFATEHPVICDGRMSPHEWIRCGDGRLMKVDGCKDGDDHFLPGPTDIAWDLAGAIVEWNMDRDAAEYLLGRFRAGSGLSTEKVSAFELAYSIFRASYCKMAWMATGVDVEKVRLQSSYRFYRAKMEEAVGKVNRVSQA